MKEINKCKLIILAVVLLGISITCSIAVSVLRTDSPILPADSFSEIKFIISFPDDSKEIVNIWYDETDDTYCLFIPGTARAEGITVYNLGRGELLLDGKSWSVFFDDVSFLATPVEYSAEYRHEDGRVEHASIAFMVMDDIPTFFLVNQSGNLDYLSLDKQNNETGSLHVLDDYGHTGYSGNLESIHLRGNSSFGFPKKSFLIETPKDYDILGVGRGDKWYLLGQYEDLSKLSVTLSNCFVSRYSDLGYVNFVYVNLFINGDYSGLYLFGKKIEASDLGIYNLDTNGEKDNYATMISEDGDIHAFDYDNSLDDYLSGFMLEVISYPVYESTFPAFRTERGNCFEVKIPDNPSAEDVAKIKQIIDEVEESIYSSDGINHSSGKHYSEYIDLLNYVDYYLVKEGFMDVDVIDNGSVYLYQKSGDDSIIHMGPVWDLDKLFGYTYPINYSFVTDPEFLLNELIYSEQLVEFEDVNNLIVERLENAFIPWVNNDFVSDIEMLYGNMSLSLEADKVRWPDTWQRRYYTTENGMASTMQDFMIRRSRFLESYFVDCEKWHIVTFWNSGELFKKFAVKDGEALKYIYPPTSYVAYFVGWKIVEGSITSLEDVVTDDLVLEARWLNVEWLLSGDMASIRNVLDDTDIYLLDTGQLDDFVEAIEQLKLE